MSSATIACDGAQDAIGYPFKNKLLLLEALDTTGMRTAESNQRLAMLGDALIQIILLDSWSASGTSKGQGNNLLSSMASNANLATIARNAGIDQHVILHPGHVGKVSDKTLATTVEALLGAIYLDTAKDMEAVSRAMFRLRLST